jgi:hypothetical protein
VGLDFRPIEEDLKIRSVSSTLVVPFELGPVIEGIGARGALLALFAALFGLLFSESDRSSTRLVQEIFVLVLIHFTKLVVRVSVLGVQWIFPVVFAFLFEELLVQRVWGDHRVERALARPPIPEELLFASPVALPAGILAAFLFIWLLILPVFVLVGAPGVLRVSWVLVAAAVLAVLAVIAFLAVVAALASVLGVFLLSHAPLLF